MKNDVLEKALEETWKNKEKFYEDTKNLSLLEVIKGIEEKYETWGTAYNRPPPVSGSGCEKHQENRKAFFC